MGSLRRAIFLWYLHNRCCIRANHPTLFLFDLKKRLEGPDIIISIKKLQNLRVSHLFPRKANYLFRPIIFIFYSLFTFLPASRIPGIYFFTSVPHPGDSGLSHVRVKGVPEIMKYKAVFDKPSIRDPRCFTGVFKPLSDISYRLSSVLKNMTVFLRIPDPGRQWRQYF